MVIPNFKINIYIFAVMLFSIKKYKLFLSSFLVFWDYPIYRRKNIRISLKTISKKRRLCWRASCDLNIRKRLIEDCRLVAWVSNCFNGKYLVNLGEKSFLEQSKVNLSFTSF